MAPAILPVFALAAILFSGTEGIFAASSPTAQAHHLHGNSDQARVHGSRPRALNGLSAVGTEDSNRVLQFSVALRLAHPETLNALITRQQAHGSAQYHQYLTPQSFTDQYAPTANDVAAVRAFLDQHGLKVTSVASNRLFVNAEGSVVQVEQAFGVSIMQYQMDKRLVYAPDQDPLIPDALAAIVTGVNGLDNVGVAHPHFVTHDTANGTSHATSTSGLSPRVTNPSPVGGLTPTDLRNAYDVSTLITNGGTGASQRVAVFELASYIPGDIVTYRAQYGLPSATINNHSVDGGVVTCATADSSSSTCDDSNIAEADLDIEFLSALAPNATQDIYTGPNSTMGVNDAYNAIVTNNVDKVVTTSWGLCEPFNSNSELRTLDNIFAQAAAQGQTIFAAAGDGGSDDCYYGGASGLPPSVDSPASDPYVLGVGGTSLALASGAYGSESEWNNGYGAGGGGISHYFSKPSWQAGSGTTNGYNTWLRGVPDVGMFADTATGYSFYCVSRLSCNIRGWGIIGGTSAGAPVWAGITADINTYLMSQSHAALGWANQTIYTLFANAQTNAPFRDVTTGNNDFDYRGTSYVGSYPSTACYDMNTGVGSPRAWNIAQDVAAGVKQGGGGACPAAPAGTNLVQDGGFENTPSSWQQFYLDGNPVISSYFPHLGGQSAYLCGYFGCDDRIWQDITVPATIHSATLTFWEDAYTDLTSLSSGNQKCLDHFYATLATMDGTVISSIPGSCATYSSGYTFRTFDVTSALQAHQGQQLQLMFRGTTANISVRPVNSSIWFVDDVSLVVS